MGADALAPTTGTATRGSDANGTTLADRVLVPAGRVALVRVLPSPTATDGPYYVVTDLGIRYAVPNAGVLPLLGFAPDQAVNVPSSLVARIPDGAVLDPAAARNPAAAG